MNAVWITFYFRSTGTVLFFWEILVLLFCGRKNICSQPCYHLFLLLFNLCNGSFLCCYTICASCEFFIAFITVPDADSYSFYALFSAVGTGMFLSLFGFYLTEALFELSSVACTKFLCRFVDFSHFFVDLDVFTLNHPSLGNGATRIWTGVIWSQTRKDVPSYPIA